MQEVQKGELQERATALQGDLIRILGLIELDQSLSQIDIDFLGNLRIDREAATGEVGSGRFQPGLEYAIGANLIDQVVLISLELWSIGRGHRGRIAHKQVILQRDQMVEQICAMAR